MNSIDHIVFGDSIGLGIATAAGLPCNCVVGRQPHEVVAAIRGTSAALIAGRTVILSTGLSNNPDGLSHAYEAIALLRDRSAAMVIVVGVGCGNANVKLDGINDKLRERVGVSGLNVLFSGPIEYPRMTGEQPGIHPWDYQDVIDQINQVAGEQI